MFGQFWVSSNHYVCNYHSLQYSYCHIHYWEYTAHTHNPTESHPCPSPIDLPVIDSTFEKSETNSTGGPCQDRLPIEKSCSWPHLMLALVRTGLYPMSTPHAWPYLLLPAHSPAQTIDYHLWPDKIFWVIMMLSQNYCHKKGGNKLKICCLMNEGSLGRLLRRSCSHYTWEIWNIGET